MSEQNPDNFTLLEHKDDLQCLMRGDLVKIIFQNEPHWKYDEENEIGAYHGVWMNGHLQFVIPAEMRGEYIVMYRSRKSDIELRDGAIVINEDRSSTQAYEQTHSDYKSLNETLKLAGLR